MIPYCFTNNYCLIIDKNSTNLTGDDNQEVKFIPPFDYTSSSDVLNVEIKINNNFDSINFKIDDTLKGYVAVNIQPYYAILNNDKKYQLLEKHMKKFVKDGSFKYIKVENSEINTPLIDKPFIVHSEGSINTLIENAGNNFIFKVGELIGTQNELYHTDERKFDIENNYNNENKRTITIEIPEGYFVKNIDDINKDYNYKRDDDKIYNFTSTYEITGNKLKINIDEYYKEINCPVKYFEDFRKVVNAAANFNKLSLVFQHN